MLNAEVYAYEIGDPKHDAALKLYLEANFVLCNSYASLACDKARLGIVGKSWYNDEVDDL